MNNSDYKYWSKVVSSCLNLHSTPFYIFSNYNINIALDKLKDLNEIIPIRHWYSLKTQPVSQNLKYWGKKGLGVEIVSEFELKAALFENFSPANILVNGIAKHNWLNNYAIKGLNVHIDSLYEFDNLTDSIKKNNWQIGLRLNVAEEHDPDDPNFKTQFGLSKEEFAIILNKAKKESINILGVHFHLQSNIKNISCYRSAIDEVVSLCKELEFMPKYIDVGGGLPSLGERPILDADQNNYFSVNEFKSIINSVKALSSVKEVWMENGRYMTAKSGVLVVKVLDAKDKTESRYLICDSGRTNNSFVSDWEDHDFFFFPKRSGAKTLTTVCGSTCMAYDHFFRKKLPKSIKIGDFFVWMNAGAYHKPWETRFSNGLIKVLWSDENSNIKVIREKESFNHWWKN